MKKNLDSNVVLGSYDELSQEFDFFSSISEKITQLADLKTILAEILNLLKKGTNCRHLAIRLIDSKGNIPIYSYIGLEKNFLNSEHWLTIKNCLCGYVASGKVDKKLPFITDKGSFFTNSISQFMKEIKVNYPQMAEKAIRDVCYHLGYESVAIIPIKLKDRIIAELFLADEDKDRFPLKRVAFLEKVGIQIGIAIHNSKLYTELTASQQKLIDLFNSASIGILELNTRGSFLQINSRGAKLLGYSSPQKLLANEMKINEMGISQKDWEKFIEEVDTKERVEDYHLVFSIG